MKTLLIILAVLFVPILLGVVVMFALVDPIVHRGEFHD